MAQADLSPSMRSLPMRSRKPLWPPTRPSLRKFLGALLPTDADLEAFVSDYFEAVGHRYSSNMDRMQKVSLLLDHEPRHVILAALREHDDERFDRSQHLLDFGVSGPEGSSEKGSGARRPSAQSMDMASQASQRLSQALRSGISGERGDGSSGLTAELISALLSTFGRRASAPFRGPAILPALARAMAIALCELIKRCPMTTDSADLLSRLRDWLLSRAVVTKLVPLLQPTAESELDLALLSEEFSAAELAPASLGHETIDDVLRSLLGGFYRGVLADPALHDLISLDTLRQLLTQAGVDVEAASAMSGVDELEAIQRLAQRIACGDAQPEDLMHAVGQLLSSLAAQPDRLRQQLAYQAAEQALSRAGLTVEDEAVADPQSNLPDTAQQLLADLHAQLLELRQSLTESTSQSSPAELAELERAYRQHLKEQFGRLTFKGISSSGTALSLPLKDVFVDLKVVAEVPESADTYSAEERRLLGEAERDGNSALDTAMHLDSLRHQRWQEQGRAEARRHPSDFEERSFDSYRERSRIIPRSIASLLSDTHKPGVVILGDPGSGKTTLLHHLVLQAVGDGQALSVLPIFVPLAAYDDHLRRSRDSLALEEFLAIYYDKWRGLPGLGPLFRQALRSGRALVLLDGLDEVLDIGTRQHVAQQAEALLHRFSGSSNRFVVTSRVVGYREAPLSGDLPHVTVLDFGPQEIERFAHKWCEAYEMFATGGKSLVAARQAEAEAGALLDDIRRTPSVALLAANPLLLTMLALLRRQVGALPDRRIELYERYVRTLLDHREMTRSPGARQSAPERVDVHTALHFLTELALWLQQHSPSGTARQRELEAAVVRIALWQEGTAPGSAAPKLELEAQRTATRFLREMRHVAGLLAERGRDAFGFLHLTFQEYFVGRALARRSAEERWRLLAPHLHNPRWREPLLLCAGWLGVIEGRTAEVDELSQRILDAKSEHEPLLHRDLLLAAALATDHVGISRRHAQLLTARLRELGEHPIATVRTQAFGALAHLARFGEPQAASYLTGVLEHASSDRQQAVLSTLTPAVLADIDKLRILAVGSLRSSAWQVRLAAVEALRDYVGSDPEVQQAFLSCLEDSDSSLREEILCALVGVAGKVSNVRNVILAGLSAAGTADRCDTIYAVSGLVNQDPEIRQLVVNALSDANGFVVRTALRALADLIRTDADIRRTALALTHHTDESVRQSAIRVLAPLIKQDAEVRQAIWSCLHLPQWRARQAAVRALAGLVHEEEVRQALLACLMDSEWLVREQAARALSKALPDDPRIRPALLSALCDHAVSVQAAAVEALSSHIQDDPETRHALAQRLQGPNWLERSRTLRALSGQLPRDKELRTTVLGYLQDSDSFLRQAAAQSLGSVLKDDLGVRRAVLLRVADPVGEVRRAVVQALALFAIADAEVQTTIWSAMTDEDASVRRAAVQGLRRIRHNPIIRKGLLERTKDSDSGVRQAAILELGLLAKQDAEVCQAILSLVNDPIPAVTRAAFRALAPLIGHKAVVRDVLFAAVGSSQILIRQAAIEVLSPHLQTDVEVFRIVRAGLRDPHWQVRAASVTALALWAELGQDKLPIGELLAARNDSEVGVRAALVSALGRWITADTAARGVVFAAMSDGSAQLRKAAIEGLGLSGAIKTDQEARQAVQDRVEDEEWQVRRTAVRALIEVLPGEPALAIKLLPWLGCYSELQDDLAQSLQDLLATALAPVVATEPRLIEMLTAMLESSSSSARLGAARTLIALPNGPPLATQLRLRALVHDLRSDFTWPERLQVAEVFLNATDTEFSERSAVLALEALNCAAEPWQDLPEQGPHVRARAARLLGQIDPIYRNDAVLKSLLRVMQFDDDFSVRDAAYHAVLRLLIAPESP